MKVTWALMAFMALMVITSGAAPAAGATPASCRTASDSAAAVLYAVKQLLASNDLHTTGVALVTDSSTCQAVVSGYNAASDSSLHITSGYVAQAGSTYVLYLFPVAGTPYKTEVIVLLDSVFHILARMQGAG